VDATSMPQILTLAKRYQVEKVATLCSDFLEADVKVDNVCQLFELAPSLLGDQEFGLPFIRENTEAILETEGFLRLSKDRYYITHHRYIISTIVNVCYSMIVLLRDDELSIDEFPLYKAVMKWAKATLASTGVTDTPDHLREVLAPLVPHIRFPCMQVFPLTSFIDSLNSR
jgi:hypothetical protein